MPLSVATAIALQECISMQLPSGHTCSHNLFATVAHTFSALIVLLLFMLLYRKQPCSLSFYVGCSRFAGLPVSRHVFAKTQHLAGANEFSSNKCVFEF